MLGQRYSKAAIQIQNLLLASWLGPVPLNWCNETQFLIAAPRKHKVWVLVHLAFSFFYGVVCALWGLLYGNTTNNIERVVLCLAIIWALQQLQLAPAMYFCSKQIAEGFNAMLYYQAQLEKGMQLSY